MRFLPAALFLLLLPALAQAHSLTKDARWSGDVRVRGQLVVGPGVKLTIEPGTTVRFMPGKLDEEGLAECGILVKGTIVANGRPGARILFTSGSESPKPGDWGEIKLLASPGSSFKDCDFRYGGWGLHIHDSEIKIEGCTFTRNSYGGVRGKGGKVELTGCTMKGMELGVRFWQGSPSIRHNEITGNETGIFCREECGGTSISFNNIYGNSDYDIKLGEAQKEDIDARNNWWGGGSPKVYDRKREGYIGRVITGPALKDRVNIEAK